MNNILFAFGMGSGTNFGSTILDCLLKMAPLLPFLAFVGLSNKANLKKTLRSRQFAMPLLALIYCVFILLNMEKFNDMVLNFLNSLPAMLEGWASKLSGMLGGNLSSISNMISGWADKLRAFLLSGKTFYWVFVIENTLFMLTYLPIKKIATKLLGSFFKEGPAVYTEDVSLTKYYAGIVYEFFAGIFYEKSPEEGVWVLQPNHKETRAFVGTLYSAAVTISVILASVTSYLFENDLLKVPFYPVFGIILLGEFFYILDGLLLSELQAAAEGETEETDHVSNYALLRPILRKLFGDKLNAENTTINNAMVGLRTNQEVLDELEKSEDEATVSYAHYIQRKVAHGLDLDQNYLSSGLEMLKGKSILFNNPFYYDLIPYAFYPLNRALLRSKRGLIVLGRHGMEDDIKEWADKGLYEITHVPEMWKVGVLTEEPNMDLHVGIITRSDVHNMKLHEANAAFFEEVEFVILIEPSKLLTTAQVGLNSLIRYCRTGSSQLTFCSTDKNCDGLIDALSHVLMTSLTEVSATNHHKGTNSYMCWESDNDRLQHRMLPNLSRYLGIGTELSFVALKNQVQGTEWYGGDAFPVVDMHWITKQYYYDLLNYAELPVGQDVVDEMFRVSPNMWNAQVTKNHYMTVEDEAFNMFEIKRLFSTRGIQQGFVNVVSPEYMLKDYMVGNDGIFNADPKAIPYIVADYARTNRNVVLRLCLRMSAGKVAEEEIRRELLLVDADVERVRESLWHEICLCCQGIGSREVNPLKEEVIVTTINNREVRFTIDTLQMRRKFCMETGKMDNMYFITDRRFIDAFLSDLKSASYIAEDERGQKKYLGTEIMGQVFQRYLPGQFFTFNGKYYEMQRVTADGQVLVRRAADHIEGRPGYRQVRNYTLSNVRNSETMGDVKDIAGLRVTTQYADIKVETPSYWEMAKHNDFAKGKQITINGIPERKYYNKQILKIEFPGDSVTNEVVRTITTLMNEVFTTLFAENKPFICALSGNDFKLPETYSLCGSDSFQPEKNVIYIIEDSKLDIGLLVAVKRNLNRIFSIICDYLDWHLETLDKSLNAPPEPAPAAGGEEGEGTGEGTTEEKPKGIIARIIAKIKGFFKKIKDFFAKIFGKLFKRKKKAADQGEIPAEEGAGTETTAEGGEGAEAAEPATPEGGETAGEGEGAGNESRALFDEEPKGTIEFEAPEVVKPGPEIVRKPYHERYFLLYGGEAVPEGLNLGATLKLLQHMGFGDNDLKQAREGKSIAAMIESNFEPRQAGRHYCDFCGCELTGKDMEVLKDGRERCMVCSRTSIKTEKEFVDLYREVIRNMDTFYGVKIKVPVKVQMVNSKKLHKALRKTFVPTAEPDGRVLGVAIRNREGYSILVENGAPRMSSMMTLAHETTHIWQYLNWDGKAISKKYGKAMELEVYEGMAKWAEIQYVYLINEPAIAKREELMTKLRDDEYGRGFIKYIEKYPLSEGTELRGKTPFMDPKNPL